MKFNDRALCVFTSGLLAGTGVAISILAVPSIKATGDPLPAWKRLYKNGSKFAISLIIATSGMAVKLFLKTEDTRYLLVSGTTALIAPYTLLVMKPVNSALFAITDKQSKETEECELKVRQLITKWDKMQYMRTALGLVGFALNVWIVTKKCK